MATEMEMDMAMDMDIPLPEELEWLEASSHLHDDYEDFEPHPEDEDDELQPPPLHHHNHHQQKEPIQNQNPPKPSLSIPPKPTSIPDPSILPKAQINGKKRFRSDDLELLNSEGRAQLEDKRNRIDDPRGENDDEDWLRYSPPENDGAEVAEPVVEEEKFVRRYASEIDGDCIPVTGVNGDRVYAKMSRVEEDRLRKIDIKGHSNALISEPIRILIQKAEMEAFTKALQASVEGQSDELPETPVVSERLWVDKYAPNSFMELLSDEQTNREVLLWLKQWDSCVFGSDIRTTGDEVLSSLRRHSSVSQHQKLSDRSFTGKSSESRLKNETFKVHNALDRENNDPKITREIWNKKTKGSGPPERKILLLCGPPGLGKTTLAHVAARHCGYRVVEINASDDRSSAAIESKILDVVQMNSVMADMKPKCLVIDEIDGALGDGKGAVEVILKMLSAEKKSDTGKENVANEEQNGRTSSRKKYRSASLSRPVICICNDLYAPALRPLRQVAKVHIFVQPTVSRVVSRLKYICNKEGLKTSSIALTALAEYTVCDIRSCLNTLQFLHKKKETLNVLEIGSQVVGRKDTLKSAFDIWKEIFQKRKAKREMKFSNGCSSMPNEFEFLHSMISNRGDYDLIFDGIHENILQLHYHDPVMEKTVKCLHSLGVSDLMHQYVMRTQRMSLQVYQPSIAIAVRGLVAQNGKLNIEWPKSFQRYRTVLMERVETLRSWQNKMSPYISRHLSTKSFVEDLISPLLHILSPPTLRPVAVHLLSEKEKSDMAQLVNTMVSYSITYKNLKSDPLPSTLRDQAVLDASILSFDPPIADLINFKGYTSGHFVLAVAVRQVLVHEVEKQKILQGSINKSIEPTDVCSKGNQTLAGEESCKRQPFTSGCATSCAENTQNAKNTLNPKQFKSVTSHDSAALETTASVTASAQMSSSGNTKKPSSGSFNFFDRFRKLSSKGSQDTDSVKRKPATSERDSRPLLFKFNEGYTNAVKRPVRIREFLV